jgi:riboflavin synthase
VLREPAGRSEHFQIRAPKELAHYIAKKGSICVDGISLTVNDVNGEVFDLNIVPHTLQETVMSDYQAGQPVNLEVDIIARYLERLLTGDASKMAESGVVSSMITEEFLAKHGFIK